MKQITKIKLFLDNQAGQLSIFFATNLLVVITFIAMIINVGMFVKAKINLQNAVDAAAWSGAAVQSRQLTNIAYMNWEMRNIYKEWMFKYYILGNLQIPAVETGPTGATARYLMTSIAGTGGQDSYNFPSVCIEFSTRDGAKICRTYQVPGIPRFGADNISGIDQATQAFVNAIEEQKNLDCARRSEINFMANNLWAYNVVTQNSNAQSISQASPQIAANRPGAWPSAFEVAVRIRNLENIVNKKPYTQGVCLESVSNPKISCGNSIKQLQSSSPSASNERIIKAFMTGYRNLGVTADDGNEMKASFTLTELPINSYQATDPYDLSNLLIPAGPAQEKTYLDLKLMLVNLATFYTAFITPPEGTVRTSEGNIATSSGCDATKIALPVPGYPLGFVKNPDFVTYYAIKGETEFLGLFNPFTERSKLTAYAAAKPFGGRIGPHLFDTSDTSTLTSRKTPNNYRSSAYFSGLDLSQLRDTRGNPVANTGAYVPGAPIPSNFGGIHFWIDDIDAPVGGWLGNPQNIRFGIPNLPYDYVSGPSGKEYTSSEQIQVIYPGGADPATGLYQGPLLQKMRSLLSGIGGNVDANAISDAILKVRAPTRYEAFNYLVPTPSAVNQDLAVDSFGEPNMSGDNDVMAFNMFAPLVGDGEDYLYRNTTEILSQAQAYISHQKPAIDKYRASMNLVAQKVANVLTPTGARVGGEAASKISDVNFALPANQLQNETPTCNSMTGQFVYFYLGGDESGISGSNPLCPRDLKTSLELYWSEKSGELTKDFYSIQYKPTEGYEAIKKDLFSAYRVSNLQGGNNGVLVNPITNVSENMIRNFYSTKLVHMRSLSRSSEGHYNENSSQFPIVSEGNVRSSGGSGTIQQGSFKNTLNLESIGISISDIDQ